MRKVLITAAMIAAASSAAAEERTMRAHTYACSTITGVDEYGALLDAKQYAVLDKLDCYLAKADLKVIYVETVADYYARIMIMNPVTHEAVRGWTRTYSLKH